MKILIRLRDSESSVGAHVRWGTFSDFLANIILAATELIIWSAPCKKCFRAYADIAFTFTVFKSNWYTFRRGVPSRQTTLKQRGSNALPLKQRWIDVVLTLCTRWVCLPSENAPAIKGKNWPPPLESKFFPFIAGPISERDFRSGMQTGCLPFTKWRKNLPSVSSLLNP